MKLRLIINFPEKTLRIKARAINITILLHKLLRRYFKKTAIISIAPTEVIVNELLKPLRNWIEKKTKPDYNILYAGLIPIEINWNNIINYKFKVNSLFDIILTIVYLFDDKYETDQLLTQVVSIFRFRKLVEKSLKGSLVYEKNNLDSEFK